MNTLNLFLLLLGIILFISIFVYLVVSEETSDEFKDNKEELYDTSFEKFDFDYSVASGTDNNEGQEHFISSTEIKQIYTDDNPTMQKVDYYE